MSFDDSLIDDIRLDEIRVDEAVHQGLLNVKVVSVSCLAQFLASSLGNGEFRVVGWEWFHEEIRM